MKSKSDIESEWDGMIAGVRAGTVPLEEAEAFLRKKGGGRCSADRRQWGENARRSVSSIAGFNGLKARNRWEAMIEKEKLRGRKLDEAFLSRAYFAWVRLGMETEDVCHEASKREKLLEEAMAERRGFSNGKREGNERALTLVDEMTEMAKRHNAELANMKSLHKKQLEEMQSRQKAELAALAKKLEGTRPWWEVYVPQATERESLRRELIAKYRTLKGTSAHLVYASMGDSGYKLSEQIELIMEKIWQRIPEARRKRVFESNAGGFSFAALEKAAKRDRPSSIAKMEATGERDVFREYSASTADA